MSKQPSSNLCPACQPTPIEIARKKTMERMAGDIASLLDTTHINRGMIIRSLLEFAFTEGWAFGLSQAMEQKRGEKNVQNC